MSWTRKDWLDLVEMLMGVVVGLLSFYFVIAPQYDIDLAQIGPGIEVVIVAGSVLFGYALRWATNRLLARYAKTP